MNIFNVECPAIINLYLNGVNDDETITRVVDTIDIYDNIEVMVSSKNMVSKIYLDGVLLIGNNLITKAINSFFNYTKLPPHGVCVKIEKNVPFELDFNKLDSIAAGVIMSLNKHYRFNLCEKKLCEIASYVSPSISYYIIGGYHKINGNNIVSHSKSIHDSYLIAFSKSKENWSEGINLNDIAQNIPYNNHFYNCLEQMAPSELLDLKNKLLSLKADKVTINGTNNSVVAYFYNSHVRFKAREELKKQKIKSIVVNSCEGIKIRHRYI